jgi:hypothetical protein
VVGLLPGEKPAEIRYLMILAVAHPFERIEGSLAAPVAPVARIFHRDDEPARYPDVGCV